MILLRRIIQQLFLLLLPWMLYSKSLGCCIGLLRWTARPRPWRKVLLLVLYTYFDFFLATLELVFVDSRPACPWRKATRMPQDEMVRYTVRRATWRGVTFFAQNDLILFIAHNATGKYLSNSSTVLVSCGSFLSKACSHYAVMTLFWQVVVEWTKHSIWYHTEHRIDTRDGI